MGWLVMAVGLTILIITGSYQNQKMSETTNAQQYASASVWASQILMIANRINDIRYVSGQQDGVFPQINWLSLSPDSRIKHQLQQGRLWVWMPEQPCLVETLRSKSRGSALIGIFQNGQLTGYQELQPV
uniref:type IV pilus biogenesis protein PilM n=1 Tax=Escherichia coli TaxID=562 RepID=UPI003EB8EFDB